LAEPAAFALAALVTSRAAGAWSASSDPSLREAAAADQ